LSQLTSGGAVAGPAILSSLLPPPLTILIGGSSQYGARYSAVCTATLLSHITCHRDFDPCPCRPLKPHRPSTVARWYSRPLTSPPDLNRLCLLPPSLSLLASTSTRHTTHDTTRYLTRHHTTRHTTHGTHTNTYLFPRPLLIPAFNTDHILSLFLFPNPSLHW